MILLGLPFQHFPELYSHARRCLGRSESPPEWLQMRGMASVKDNSTLSHKGLVQTESAGNMGLTAEDRVNPSRIGQSRRANWLKRQVDTRSYVLYFLSWR